MSVGGDGEIYIQYGDHDFAIAHLGAEENLDFEKLIDPRNKFIMAKIFQESFINYTLKNTQNLIDWLNDVWEEEKVNEIFVKSGVEDQRILEVLKLNFQKMIKKLERIRDYAYEPYTPEKISSLIEEKKIRDRNIDFSVKNVSYIFRDALPLVEEQNFICSDGTKVWLELTN